MHLKKVERLRRAKSTRMKCRELSATRLTVHRTPRHIYAQVIDSSNKVVASASTLEKDLCAKLKYSGNVEAAALIGEAIAERAIKANVEQVAFDRS
ncbi:MAG: 50S ribosomal protein L18, partial [Gammaproteobacteria bacterium]|nr:50S ribosomal protein L18 [Gammaproteobacteria bacterium]